jgi:hypothetical protein
MMLPARRDQIEWPIKLVHSLNDRERRMTDDCARNLCDLASLCFWPVVAPITPLLALAGRNLAALSQSKQELCAASTRLASKSRWTAEMHENCWQGARQFAVPSGPTWHAKLDPARS